MCGERKDGTGGSTCILPVMGVWQDGETQGKVIIALAFF